MIKTNVLNFPEPQIKIPDNSEEAYENLVKVRSFYAEEIADEAITAVIKIAENYGYFNDKFSEKTALDLIAIEENIKSALLRYTNIHHPLQNYIDEKFVIKE